MLSDFSIFVPVPVIYRPDKIFELFKKIIIRPTDNEVVVNFNVKAQIRCTGVFWCNHMYLWLSVCLMAGSCVCGHLSIWAAISDRKNFCLSNCLFYIFPLNLSLTHFSLVSIFSLNFVIFLLQTLQPSFIWHFLFMSSPSFSTQNEPLSHSRIN